MDFVKSFSLFGMDVRDHGLEVRSQAIGMLRSGLSQQNVSLELDVSVRSVKRWWSAYNESGNQDPFWQTADFESGQ